MGAVGANLSTRRLLGKSVRNVFVLFLEQCGDALRQHGLAGYQSCSDSLVLAALGVFMLCLDGTGVQTFVTFLSKMKEILSVHRSALRGYSESELQVLGAVPTKLSK